MDFFFLYTPILLNSCISLVRTGKMHKLYDNPFQRPGEVCSADPAEDPQKSTSHYILHPAHFILYYTHYIVSPSRYTLYSTDYILYLAHYTLYTLSCTLYTKFYKLQAIFCKMRCCRLINNAGNWCIFQNGRSFLLAKTPNRAIVNCKDVMTRKSCHVLVNL